ncbi:glucan biosynthesis protein G [Shewanella frigidimarina]|uniref:glucan biosynthesis protein G n=1 Tax=Shewanella frigidimarina TaxID=56812 RepID=UPI003D793CED
MLRIANVFFNLPVKQMIDDRFSLKILVNLVVSLFLVSSVSIAYAETPVSKTDGKPFSHDSVVEVAQKLSQTPFIEPKQAPEALTKIDYSTYRQINFQQHAAIWGNAPTPFSIQLFAPGYIYKQLVDIDVVENGKSFPVAVSESSFRVPDESIGKLLEQVGKYAGFRLHYPINRDDYKDEFLVFQGASYFRGVSKGQAYGLSTRGLAINVADPKGEEYPLFKKFWIERPSSHQEAIVVHALLDSVSVTGAYRFAIYPGDPTRMGVDVKLFPRQDVKNVGLAPLTSMFMHGGIDRADTADYRPAVHDSEGLLMEKGNNEKIWRPLNNPRGLQVSSFMDENPKGFGLMQPHRKLDYYQDLEANYHLRPSAWVEPTGDWGKGRVELVEIPSDSEANDNIVAYWKPEQGLKKGQPFTYSYQLTWVDQIPKTEGKVKVVRTAGGRKLSTDKNEIVIDYSHINANDVSHIRVDASISSGAILESRIESNPSVDGARVFITFDPQDAEVAELRVQLSNKDKPLGMTWLYRFTAEDWPL